MYTRRVVFQIKAESSAEFTRLIEGRLHPRLRAQEGCRHKDTFSTPAFSEAVINGYRDTAECAAVYARTAYPEGSPALAGVLDGAPRVETSQISSAALHKVNANRREGYRTSQLHRG